MPARLPDFRRHNDGGFEANDIVALAGHGVPPEFLDVALEFRAQRAVVPKAVDAAVNLGGLVNEPAPLAQRHDFLHKRILFRLSHCWWIERKWLLCVKEANPLHLTENNCCVSNGWFTNSFANAIGPKIEFGAT